MLTARHLYFSKVLAARKNNLTTSRARKNKHTARMLANARKDHSIPLRKETAAERIYCKYRSDGRSSEKFLVLLTMKTLKFFFFSSFFYSISFLLFFLQFLSVTCPMS